MTNHILSIVLFLPLLGLIPLLLIPSNQKRTLKLCANAVMLAGFLVSVPLALNFNANADGYQFVERAAWIPSIGASYNIGIDGISLLLVMLTTLIGFLATLSSWSAVNDRLKEYYALFMILQAGMIGVFVSLDLFLFYVFWEVVLIPMYFIIGIWGGQRRLYSAIKFFIYTLAGSVLMLLGILTLYFQHAREYSVYTFDLARLLNTHMTLGTEQFVFWTLFIGFAIKVPMFPFHTWLPDAHVEAPTAGSVVLASIMLKMGGYGFLRFSLPLAPNVSKTPWVVNTMVTLSIIAILYGALVCLMQKDWKKLIAYSSVSHMGFVTLGIFALNHNGIAGSVIQQINHGISTGMLFLIVGVVYERRHTREISSYGGLAHVMPNFAVVFAIAMWSSAALPLLNGFIGEFTILSGAFQANKLWAVLASLGVIFAAAYLLWLYQRTMLGEVTLEANRKLRDLSPREWAVFLPLIAWAFWIGVYPKQHFDVIEKPVQAIVERVSKSTAAPTQAAEGTRP
jgi:NADH-quinone oxidoreductase subunit M